MGRRTQTALYHRVSTVDQHPDLARRELRTAARRYKMQVALEVEETGSGANNDRPGFVRVMDAARRGRIDALLVWKLDRFGRSALDLLTHLRELESLGIRFVAITQGIDIRPGGDATSRLLLTMLTAVSEFERDLIVERTKLGIAKARRAGKQIGRPRVPRPPQRQVTKLRRAGYTWVQVAEKLKCSEWAARKAAVEKGGPKRRSRALKE
jgi:DNA invertase Pin-like site-specific DNA recombinase